MKLAIIGPVYPYRGGIAHFTTRLGQVLKDSEHEALMISFSRQYPAFLYPGKSDKDPSQEHPAVDTQFLLDPLYPWTWFKTAQAIKKWRPQLVLIQWWTTFWGPAFFVLANLLRISRLPVSFVIHNVMPHEARFFDRWIAKMVFSSGTACIVLSPREEGRLRNLLPGMRIMVSQLPVEAITTVRLSRELARQQLGIPPGIPVLLFFGIVRAYKGLGVLIEAISQLKETGLTPTLLVVGEFWEDEQHYRNQIAQLGLSDQIRIDNRFIPNEEVGQYFSAADYFVAPYIGGTQSAAVKVAMDFGLPIFASDQISSDLPKETYPVMVHQAGNSAELARDIAEAIKMEGEFTHPASRPVTNGWEDFIAAIQHLLR